MAKTPVPLTDAQKAAKTAERAKAKIDAFLKVAPKRVDAALKALRLVGQVGNRASYGYTDDQVAKLTKVLNDAVKDATGKFAADAKADASGFSF